MNHYQALLTSSALSAAFLLVGCATPGGTGTTGSPAYADFLSHPDRLEPVSADDSARIWVDQGVDFGKYDQFLIEPIQVHLADNADYKAVDPTQLKAMTDYFYGALVKALGSPYKVVSKPGPGVLRLRIAITNLVPTKPEYSVAALVIPYATVADIASGSAAGRPAGSTAYLGQTGIAGSLIDAQTNRTVAEYADNEVGRKYVVDTKQGVTGAVTTGVDNYVKSYSTWAYAEQAFDGWAADLRRWLDKARKR